MELTNIPDEPVVWRSEDGQERAAREDELEALTREVALLHELPDIACQHGTEESTADLIVRRATEALMSDGAVLAVRADPDQEIHPLAWAGVEIEEVRAYCAGLAGCGSGRSLVSSPCRCLWPLWRIIR